MRDGKRGDLREHEFGQLAFDDRGGQAGQEQGSEQAGQRQPGPRAEASEAPTDQAR